MRHAKPVRLNEVSENNSVTLYFPPGPVGAVENRTYRESESVYLFFEFTINQKVWMLSGRGK